jgi:hypothetical protein
VALAFLMAISSNSLVATPARAGAPPKLLDAPLAGSGAVSSVVIHNLYWDSNWDADNPSLPSRATLDDFTHQMVASPYLSQLSQYGFSAATFNGSDQAVTACPAPASTTLNYLDISGWILCEKHHLSSTSTKGVNLWVVYAPSGYGASSCDTFDAFHALTLPSVIPPDAPQLFAIVLSQCSAIASGNGLDGATIAATHEIVEAITDPTPGAGWIDRAAVARGGAVTLSNVATLYTEGEASDICDGADPSLATPGPPTGDMPRIGPDSTTPQGYALDYYWSNAAGACVPAPGSWQPVAGSFVSNMAVAKDANNDVEVFARGSNNTLLETGEQAPGGTWPGT